MTTAEHPGVWTRVVASLHGEVSAATWEAYRDAGLAVFEVLAESEDQRKADVTGRAAVPGHVAAAARAALPDPAADPGQEAHMPQLRQMWAEADTAGRYAKALLRPGAGQELHEAIEEKLHTALEVWYRLGQLAADPRLHHQAARHDRTVLADPNRLPGGASFDPWCLTAPNSRAKWQADPRAGR